VISAILHLRNAPDGSTVEVLAGTVPAGSLTGRVVGSAVVLDGVARVDGLELGLEYVAVVRTPGRSRRVAFRTSGRNVNVERRGSRSGTVELVR
jgi:hypothetical protein